VAERRRGNKMAVALADVSADTGEIYTALDGGTTAATSIIERAENFVKLVTGTTTGYDVITRPLADAMIVNQVIGGIDSVNKTIGSLSVGNKDMRTMQQYFQNEAVKAAVIKGYSLDGLRILFVDSAKV
jgi:hypothetical protein